MSKSSSSRVVVVGSGVAGLSCALTLAERGHEVTIVTKARTSDSATFYAQGGIASQWFSDLDDTSQSHVDDTVNAGAGLCDQSAVEILVGESKDAISRLMSRGAKFDELSDGSLARTLEGGHHNPRIIHSGGDKTGEEVERALVHSAAASLLGNLSIVDHHMVTQLLTRDGQCCGVECTDQDGELTAIEADHVVLSTGGAGQLYSVTTNPLLATADGVALALNAGVLCSDLEFMQFHPTALHIDNMPRPLLSEALRGAGAVLRDETGAAFMSGVHPMGDLAPRDVVSRQIAHILRDHNVECVYLDARNIDDFEVKYPTIFDSCIQADLDPRKEVIPVSPAAHYYCGGVTTDTFGATSMPRLWAAGEVACNGVHGANRLASNSLLDGLVYGERVAVSIDSGQESFTTTGIFSHIVSQLGKDHELFTAGTPRTLINPSDVVNMGVREHLQGMMTRNVGIVRRHSDMESAQSELKILIDEASTLPAVPQEISVFGQNEIANLVRVSESLIAAALSREESRGCHTREEYTGPQEQFQGRFITNGASSPFAFVSV